ncbi:MAG: N-6 DNA methylase, partial [Planctomycetes bacterium]|nr:N-6 DNA methylase [Planctomycetota bacterium]
MTADRRGMDSVEQYLTDLRDIRSSGAAVAETSYYSALANLLNDVGVSLTPAVRCVMQVANRGAGLPDGGLFTAEQNQPVGTGAPLEGQMPSRGVIEIKGLAEEVTTIAGSAQVKRYAAKYGPVLVTNYRDFLLLGADAAGSPLPQERFTLAGDEETFWRIAAHPKAAAQRLGGRLVEYLKRVMLSVAPLADPRDVAWFLASYARDAKGRVDERKGLPVLAQMRMAIEASLGLEFQETAEGEEAGAGRRGRSSPSRQRADSEKGERFFRSTLVQTLFYGVFSAWVLWHRERADRTDRFDWKTAGWTLRVPFIRDLYEHLATPSKLGALGLVEVLDWTNAALNRVNRGEFFARFLEEHAVQYFYEPFLEAFDPDLRREYGVWYTPPEIVKFQVDRVDAVLREELGLSDGLADPSVVILDPCCGTGAYLVEVLRRIAETLRRNGGDALVAADLKKAATTRVFGFEILSAPFVIAHLQIGLLLHNYSAPLSSNGGDYERVGVYFTNALTGWNGKRPP